MVQVNLSRLVTLARMLVDKPVPDSNTIEYEVMTILIDIGLLWVDMYEDAPDRLRSCIDPI